MSERVSEAVSSFAKSGQTHSMELIFFPLILLILTGSIANNFQSSGVQTTPTLPATCQQVAICYPTNTNGCDKAVSNCNFTTTTTFSFLDSNSPFTLLVHGDVVGFLSYLFNNPGNTHSSNVGKINNCKLIGQIASGKDSNTQYECNSVTFLNNNNWPKSPQFPFCGTGCPPIVPFTADSQYCTQLAASCFVVTTSQVPFKPSTINGLNFFGTPITGANSNKNCSDIAGGFQTGTGNGSMVFSTWTLLGNQTNYITAGGSNSTTSLSLYGDYCDGANPLTNGFAVVQFIETAPGGLGAQTGIFGFLLGIILFFAGLGLTFAGNVASSGFTIGTNQQITRFCEIIGIGLIAWSFIYSEFGGWLNNLSLNLSVIAFVSLTSMFFFGLFWRIFSLD